MRSRLTSGRTTPSRFQILTISTSTFGNGGMMSRQAGRASMVARIQGSKHTSKTRKVQHLLRHRCTATVHQLCLTSRMVITNWTRLLLRPTGLAHTRYDTTLCQTRLPYRASREDMERRNGHLCTVILPEVAQWIATRLSRTSNRLTTALRLDQCQASRTRRTADSSPLLCQCHTGTASSIRTTRPRLGRARCLKKYQGQEALNRHICSMGDRLSRLVTPRILETQQNLARCLCTGHALPRLEMLRALHLAWTRGRRAPTASSILCELLSQRTTVRYRRLSPTRDFNRLLAVAFLCGSRSLPTPLQWLICHSALTISGSTTRTLDLLQRRTLRLRSVRTGSTEGRTMLVRSQRGPSSAGTDRR